MYLIPKLLKGFLIGFINSFLGSGGGIIAIPMFKKEGMNQNCAHANSIALILLLTIISAGIYLYTGKVDFYDCLNFIPIGVVGSAIGAILMPKIPSKFLRKIFALFMIWAGYRMIFK